MAPGFARWAWTSGWSGPLPTPGIAFLTRSMRADAGVVISASHNPFQDNGIKFFSREGFKLDDETERRIEELVFDECAIVEAFARSGRRYRQGGANRRRDRPLPRIPEVVSAAHALLRRTQNRDRLRQRRRLQGRS